MRLAHRIWKMSGKKSNLHLMSIHKQARDAWKGDLYRVMKRLI